MANEDIKQAVKDLGINVPVMATRMVGNRLELYLYGGGVMSWEPGNPLQDTFDRMWLDTLNMKELKEVARQAHLKGYTGMNKAQLIEALAG